MRQPSFSSSSPLALCTIALLLALPSVAKSFVGVERHCLAIQKPTLQRRHLLQQKLSGDSVRPRSNDGLLPPRNRYYPSFHQSTSLELDKTDGGNKVEEETSRVSANGDRSVTTRRSRKNALILTILGSELAVLTTVAKLGLFPGPIDATTGLNLPYTNTLLLQDISVTILTAILGYAVVKAITVLVEYRHLDPRDARKLIHTLSAPLFILLWPLFSAADLPARLFCACVPSINAVRLYLASMATTAGEEQELARALSRSGQAQEALGGPFIYVCMLAGFILAFWRTSPVGIVALSTMAAGDGLADLVGRRWGKGNAWPGLSGKSVAGTAAFWIASTLTTTGLLLWMSYWKCLLLPLTTVELVARLVIIGLITALVELIPGTDDNFTVPISAALLAMILLQ